jgi:hypothetical protein
MKRQRNTFLTPLVVEVMPSGKRFKLHYEFTYLWKREYIEIHVAAGFVTDFASVPRIFRIIIPKLGKWNKPAVLHDAIYQNAIAGHQFTRKEGDIVFRDGMRDLGVSPWRIFVMYWGLRMFGWTAWRKR